MTGMYDYFEELGGGKIGVQFEPLVSVASSSLSPFASVKLTLLLAFADITSSYYVGDAAGRPARVGFAKDHGDGDRKWADNLGLRFFTPEVVLFLLFLVSSVGEQTLTV